MGYSQIDLHIGEGIATLTLNRPEKMNAFTGTMMNEIIDAMDRTDADDSVRAVIFTGAGATVFRYLGEMLPLLLRQPSGPVSARHRLRLGYGGGARPAVRAEFERRFGVLVGTGYGMSEIGIVFEARPVITVEEAVRGELEVIAWRDGLKRK